MLTPFDQIALALAALSIGIAATASLWLAATLAIRIYDHRQRVKERLAQIERM